MFKNGLKILQNCHKISNINSASFQSSANLREKWDLLTAVLIERKAVISPALTELEQEYQTYLKTVEYERSLKSDIEMKLEKEQKLLGKKDVEDLESVSTQTTQDFIDACKEELAKFKPAERITSADRSNNQKSLDRRLDKPLVFVLNQKLGDQSFYILPQGEIKEGESLRECADRILKEKCGNDIKVQIYGNAPCGFYKFKYPKEIRSQKDRTGAKVFIYFGRYSSGSITPSLDFKWLDKSELDKVLPEQYKKSVLPVLIDG